MEKKKVSDLRQDYQQASLDIGNLSPDPLIQFEAWFHEALDSKIPEPNAMILATASKTGRPSARTVLLKGFSDLGFIFYTNYNSRKGCELAENPFAALNFNWLGLQRQIRINGSVTRLDSKKSEEYFKSRPKGSQIGAWISPQSEVISSRAELEDKVKALTIQYANESFLPKPDQWGGFIVNPHVIEFWQGRVSRLHDRFQYRKQGEHWIIERLAP